MLEKKLLISIKTLVYLSFLMPLLVMGDTFIFPFVFPKAIYFRILVEIMLGLYLIICLINKDYRPKKTPLLLALGSLLLALFLACLFGVDFQRSLWGNHERMSGWFTLIHFGAYFVMIASVFKSWPEWKWLLRWSLLISLVVGVTGLNFLLADNSIMKIGGGGTLGNQIYLANFVLFHVFIAWLLFRKEEKNIWKIFAAIIGVTEILIMIYNSKRGPFLGLLAGLFVGILLYSLLSRVRKWRLAGIGLIGLAIIFSILVFVNRQSAFVQKIPMVGSLVNISFKSGTGETRAIAWEIAYKAWKERPVFGWGVENFYYAFNKFYNPKSLEHGYYETWFDRSHNIFLDYLSTSGALGFLAYLGVFGTVFYLLWRGFKARQIDLDRLVFLSMFFIAYALQNFFVFDHLSSYLTFFLILAFTDVITRVPVGEGSKPITTKRSRSSLPIGWTAIIIIVILFLIFKTNYQPALANHGSLEAQQILGQNFAAGIEKVKETFTIYTPHLVDLRNDISRVIISFSQDPAAMKSELYKQSLGLITDELKKTTTEHPLEINAFMLLGQYYALMGDLAKAEEIFQSAQNLSPKRQQVSYLLTKTKFMRQDYEGAIKLLEKTINDDPKIADSYWYLGLIYNDLGEGQKAFDYIKIALEKGKAPQQIPELLFAADLSKKFNDLEMARNLYEQVIARQTNDWQTLLKLSEVYEGLGNKEKAQEMRERAALYAPKTPSSN